MELRDRFLRPIRSLRISLTDRCNFRCSYCLPYPHLIPYTPREDLLSFEEITFVVEYATSLGIGSVRLTGGEPLLRKGIEELIGMLKTRTSLKDLSLTTNGFLLAEKAQALKQAGLDRVNISLDSLNPQRFFELTGGDLKRVFEGIYAAVECGFNPVKINTLLLKGVNDDELFGLCELARKLPVVVRFLELMPIGEGKILFEGGRFLNGSLLREELIRRYGLVPEEKMGGNGPARYYRFPDGRGILGFITPVSEKFCASCTRFRLTAKGELYPCMAYTIAIPLKDAIRKRDEEALRAGFLKAAFLKPDGHHWDKGEVTTVSMVKLGG